MPQAVGRGRPRKFDKDEVLQIILKVFWKKGFAATSLDDISSATKLSRPSLYAAYGNKLAMYLLAVETFGQRMATDAVSAVAEGPDLRSGLKAFYKAALDIYLSKENEMALGCLVFTTAVTEAPNEPRITQALQTQLKSFDAALTALISARAPNASVTSIGASSHFAANTLLSLATRARAGTPRAQLTKMSTEAVDIVILILEK